jgi:hypothetical protein
VRIFTYQVSENSQVNKVSGHCSMRTKIGVSGGVPYSAHHSCSYGRGSTDLSVLSGLGDGWVRWACTGVVRVSA